jgi:hypothetical protein
MAPGIDFRHAIEQTIAGCDAMIVLIGPGFDAQRLEEPDDVVRQELGAALARDGFAIFPVLVNGAPMPELPPALGGIARRNALELSDSRFDHDADRLTAAIKATVPKRRSRLWLALIPAALALVIAGYYFALPRYALVPKVTGLPSSFAAEKALVKADLRLDPNTKSQVDDHAKAGSVLGQAPQAGTRVEQGSAVTILVAAASQRVEVPELTNLRVAAAINRAQAKKFFVRLEPEAFDSAARVRSQNPKAGARAAPGTPIRLTLK